jgi:hypothetical protein
MSTPTPETDAARASWAYAGPGVHVNFARKLERERNQLQRWKEEMLTVWEKWDAVDAAVRKHPDTVVGHDVSDTVLRFIKERDELSGRTISCDHCNKAVADIAELNQRLIDRTTGMQDLIQEQQLEIAKWKSAYQKASGELLAFLA